MRPTRNASDRGRSAGIVVATVVTAAIVVLVAAVTVRVFVWIWP